MKNLSKFTVSGTCEFMFVVTPDEISKRYIIFDQHNLFLYYTNLLVQKAKASMSSCFRTTASRLSNTFATSLSHDGRALQRLQTYYETQPEANIAISNFVHELLNARRVLVTGIGKSGYVARRMAASLASVGVPAHFVHGTEWVHGDLGVACPGDLVVGFSHSGNTEELAVLPVFLKPRGVPLAAIIGSNDSALGRTADHVIVAPADSEILDKVPSRSIVVQEAVVNGIIAEVVEHRSFTINDFIVNHPGGSIGKSR